MFKFVVLFAFVAAASALSPQRHYSTGAKAFNQHKAFAPAKSYTATKSYASTDDSHAEVKYLDSDVRPDGFHYAVETTNSIKADASGDEHGNIHGAFEWVSPEGEHIALSYVADENGYQPDSALLPTPPPIPEAILRSLAYIAAHPHKEEVHHGRHH